LAVERNRDSVPNVTRCQIRSGRFERSGFVDCSGCGLTFHENCLEYHSEYECRGEANEPAIGALEL
jgi:hypothetical protein